MQSIIKELLNLASKKKISDKKLFEEFLKGFYGQGHYRDFENYSNDDLLNLAINSFEFFCKRHSGEFKVRIYNPTVEKDGFSSHYTVLDVVNDDMPFLLDSAIIQFEKAGVEIKNIIHPVYKTIRAKDGTASDIGEEKHAISESVIQFHVSKMISEEEIEAMENDLIKIFESVRLTVDDWQEMVNVAKEIREKLNHVKTKHGSFDLEEGKEFIDWVINNNFIFLAFVEYDIEREHGEYVLKKSLKSRLGLGKSKYDDIKPRPFNRSSEEIAESIKNPYFVEIIKSRYKSQIHRYANVDRIRIQKFDDNGHVVGEYRFIGLFTSSVYYQNADLIPLIRRKISKVVENSGYERGSHNAKDLFTVLDSYPRDELFQAGYEDLFRISTGIVGISGRSIVRYFSRKDKFNRFVSALVFVPRDRFNTSLREKIKTVLSEGYEGEITEFYVQTTESNLTRLHIIINIDENNPKKIGDDEIENRLIKICRLWIDDFRDAVNENFEEKEVKNILKEYCEAFSVSYTNQFDAKRAVADILNINKSIATNNIISDIYHSSIVDEAVTELKIYSPEKEMQLSDIMPVLDSFGFNIIHEHTYVVSLATAKKVWIHYFNLNLTKTGAKLNDGIKKNFEETIGKIWKNEAVSGYLNQLIASAEIDYRGVSLLRAYSKYLYQAGFRYSQKYTSEVLVKHSNITKLLVKLFEVKFDPEFKGNREDKIHDLIHHIKSDLSKVSEANDDLVIRRFFNAIEATIRTNFYQKTASGEFKDYNSFKFDSSKLQDLPLPVPFAEIFVFSSIVEAIHLRGGKVARGGLRWSDRHEDFRTEVLGLMKAQMTKNAVIVPVGSKGGFVVKKDTAGMTRDQIQQHGIECYKTFLRGLLDITDNIVNGKVVHPQDVVRYDEADPYLVVAADKGTATFSDIANGISAEYNFWLGDAFASGGSVGYDHKKMGITAKGGWISVRRHFLEMGTDIQKQDFTCVGIGDLSGDVFGNGMLLSKHTRLVAAFNHLHIFLDPNPDSASSFKERQRMFNLPRSSWTDYNPELISKGGGIFERSAKQIKISAEVKQILAIEEDALSPNELIKAILKSPVDLIWNGGIGTYVKAIDESNVDVGDRFNDEVRINGFDLRCKVVGEGGNLGFTQKGRIEYALNGGRINTDAMDNSAGVDCSDHEVNIKIALIDAMKNYGLSLEKRNEILESMTDEVGELVLNDNRLQTQAISILQSTGHVFLGDYIQLLDKLERSGLLNRGVEYLPNNKEILKRQTEKRGMTRPELCVMLAYSKMDLYSNLVSSDLVKDKFFEKYLLSYFPKILQTKFSDQIKNHQLRNEIIATQVTNLIVNRSGISFVSQIASDHGFNAVDIAKSYIIACNSFGLEEVWAEIEALDGKVSFEIQTRMFLAVNKLLERSVLWLLRNRRSKNISDLVLEYRSIIAKMLSMLDAILAKASRDSYDRKLKRYLEAKVPEELAIKVAAMDPLGSAYDIIEISQKSDLDIRTISKIYFKVGTRLNIKWLRSMISSLNIEDHWEKLSAKTITEDLYHYQMKITNQVVGYSKGHKGEVDVKSSTVLDKWIESQSFLVERYDNFISDLQTQVNPKLSLFVVALNRIKALLN